MEKPKFIWGSRTYLMGIINLTPDSFSGDGLADRKDPVHAALEQTIRFKNEGADIIDLGAESSRPGAEIISSAEELERLMPTLTAIIKEDLDVIVSVDTFKSSVADQSLRAGADWINDIWGLRADKKLAEIVAHYQAGIVIMHNGRELFSNNGISVEQPEDILQQVKADLSSSIALARQAGIHTDKIILDPGLGFGKNREQNLELINRLDELKEMGFPILVGPSRKSFIGSTLNLPPAQRLEGTSASVAISIARGADILRVHDVQAMFRVARMSDAIVRH